MVVESVPTRRFAAAGQGIYIISIPDSSFGKVLQYYDFATQTTREIARIEGSTTNGLTVTPDGRSILYPLSETGSDLMPVENFR